GRTPRSNPVVYIGAFDDIRELFAQTDLARQRGLGASAFSFNSAQGQCERCRGAGFEKIEMQFLSDVYIRCPECNGRRYRPHILEVKVRASVPGHGAAPSHWPSPPRGRGSKLRQSLSRRAIESSVRDWSIADLLDATVDEAFQGLVDEGHSLLVIEHNLDLIRAADWVIDLGPEAGDAGGKLVVEGTPETVAACEESHTGRALREHVNSTAPLEAVA